MVCRKIKKELNDEEELDDIPPPEGAAEVKEGKRLEILTPKKLLTRFPMLMA